MTARSRHPTQSFQSNATATTNATKGRATPSIFPTFWPLLMRTFSADVVGYAIGGPAVLHQIPQGGIVFMSRTFRTLVCVLAIALTAPAAASAAATIQPGAYHET